MPTFSKTLLSFADTKAFSRLVSDYLAGDLPAGFFSFPFSPNAFPEVIQQREKTPVDRQLLLDVIKEQYQKLNAEISFSLQVEKNISSLVLPTAFTVTTGHQLNLFTGPVYFIYKIVSTINLAWKLKELFPVYQFIPVYWMASEDHDLDEINHIYLFGKKIEWHPASSGAAGRINCTGIQPVIDELNVLLGNNSQ